MAINFPSSLDSLTNPTTSSPLNSPSHAGQHSDANDAIEALQAKVGADSSAVTSSHDYKIAQLESGKVDKSTYDAHSILQATADNTPVALTVGEQTVVGRATGGNISALSIDSDLSSVSANDDTIPSAKATKTALDGKIANVVDDTTPQLGGQLDVNGNAIGDGTLELLKFSETASAVNEVTVKNAATGDAPEIQATGDDTNIDLKLVGKGTGGTIARIKPRLVTAASYTTDTGTSLNCDTTDQFQVTAQAGALKFNNPGGTPVGGQKLIIRIKDNGTARALTYDTQFRAMGVALPSTTVLSKTLYMGFIYNATDTKWDLVAVAQEA